MEDRDIVQMLFGTLIIIILFIITRITYCAMLTSVSTMFPCPNYIIIFLFTSTNLLNLLSIVFFPEAYVQERTLVSFSSL